MRAAGGGTHGAASCALRDHRQRSREAAELLRRAVGWEFDTGDAATEAVSQPGDYGFVDGSTTDGGINGGIGGGEGYEDRVLFYVGVSHVEAALDKGESLGGKRRMGPEGTPGTLVVGQFTDPEGHLIGVAGTE